jgi:hypothetical protein
LLIRFLSFVFVCAQTQMGSRLTAGKAAHFSIFGPWICSFV